MNRSDPTGEWTIGFCAAGSVGGVFQVGVNDCIVKIFDATSSTPEWAFTTTLYGYAGLDVNADIGEYIQVTSARSWSSLAGWFVGVAFQAEIFGGAGGVVFWTAPWSNSSSRVVGGDIGLTQGLGIGVTAGASWTAVVPLVGWGSFLDGWLDLLYTTPQGFNTLPYHEIADQLELKKATSLCEKYGGC